MFLVVVVAGEPKSGVQEEEANLLATEEEEKSCRRKKGRFREGPFRKGLRDSIGDWPLPYLFWLDRESVALWAGKTAINNSYSVAAAKDIVAIVLRKKQVCRTVKIISGKNWVLSSCRNFKSVKRKKSFQQIQKKGIKSEHLGCTSPPRTHAQPGIGQIGAGEDKDREKERQGKTSRVCGSFIFVPSATQRSSQQQHAYKLKTIFQRRYTQQQKQPQSTKIASLVCGTRPHG